MNKFETTETTETTDPNLTGERRGRRRAERRRAERRKDLIDSLPADLQLTGTIKPTKWDFDGNLMRRRNLDSQEYANFFGILRLVNKKLDVVGQQELEKLKIESLKNKREVGEILKLQNQIETELQKCTENGRWDVFVFLLKSSKEAGIILDQEKYQKQIETSLQKCAGNGWWDKYVSLLKSSIEGGIILDKEKYRNQIETGLQECAGRGWWVYFISLLKSSIEAGIIIDKEKFQNQIETKLQKRTGYHLWYEYISLLKLSIEAGIITDKEKYQDQIETGLQEYADGRQWNNFFSLFESSTKAGIIPDKEKSRNQIEKGLQECADGSQWDNFFSLFKSSKEVGIILDKEKSQNQIETELQKCANKGWWGFFVSLLKSSKDAGIIIDKEKFQNQIETKLQKRAENVEWNSLLELSIEVGIKLDKEKYQNQIETELQKRTGYHLWYEYISLLKLSIEAGIITDKEKLETGLQKCIKSGRWDFFFSLLKLSIESGIITDKEKIEISLQECAENGLWDAFVSLLELSIEVGIIPDPKKHTQEFSFLQKIINQYPADKEYLTLIISAKLQNGENLNKFFQEEYNDYLNLKEKTQEWNEKLDENKKVKEVDKWWEKHQKEFADLQAIDRKLASSIFFSFKDKGLLALQSHLEIYSKALSDFKIASSIKELIKKNKIFSPDALDKLLQVAHAFLKLNRVADFQEILENENDFQAKLDHRLVEIIAESLDIKLDKDNLSLEGWNTQYIHHLTSNEEMIKRINGSDDVLELYKEMLKATFENRFDEFITDTNQPSEIGRDVARHNQEIEKTYAELGISFEKWLHYRQTQDFIIETEKEVKSLPRFVENLKSRTLKVVEEISFLEKKITPREYLPLVHLLEGAKDKGLKALTDYDKLNEKYANFVQRINQIKERYPDLDYSSIFEHTQHLKEAIELFKKKDEAETVTSKKAFRIKLWDRDPKKDFFQGNYTHCCIAVGVKPGDREGGLMTHDPSTVMHYLADQGIQVAEVLDESRKNPIAQVWLFVSKDELGEPILVVDNFEVHQDYVSDVHINNKIRDNMFEFLRNYAQSINIFKVGLAQVITNDIDWSKMNSFSVPPIEKVGGYLSDYTLNISGRKGRYYLEAYNNHNLAKIMNLKTELKNKKSKVWRKFF